MRTPLDVSLSIIPVIPLVVSQEVFLGISFEIFADILTGSFRNLSSDCPRDYFKIFSWDSTEDSSRYISGDLSRVF